MIKLIKTFFISIISAIALLVPVAAPVAVYAQTPNIDESLCTGASLSVSQGGDCSSTAAAEDSVNNIIRTVINVFSLVVGVISVIFIIVGGFKYITSGGDTNSVTSARNTIMYAIVGLVIVALSQIMVQFVLNRVTNSA